MDIFITAIVFIFIFSLLILIHEWGHFTAAKRAGVKVEEFGFGLPPRIWGKKKGETLYSINWIPFGGFVRMLGEDSTDPKALENKRSFAAQSLRTQAWIVCAGVVMNLLMAFALLTVGFWLGIEPIMVDHDEYLDYVRSGQIEVEPGWNIEEEGNQTILPRLIYHESDGFFFDSELDEFLQEGDWILAVNGATVLTGDDFRLALDATVNEGFMEGETDHSYVSHDLTIYRASTGESLVIEDLPDGFPPPVIHSVSAGSPAEEAGLLAGDIIYEIDNVSVNSSQQVIEITQAAEGTLNYEIKRGNEFLDFQIEPNEEGRIGVGLSRFISEYTPFPFYQGYEPHTVTQVHKTQYTFSAPWHAVGEMWRLGTRTAVMFVDVLQKISTGQGVPEGVSGPVGIAQMTHFSIQGGFSSVLVLIALLSLSLGVINILPIPALDGGRLAFIIYQAVTGKKPNVQVEAMIHMIGFIVLIALIFFVTYNDILNLF